MSNPREDTIERLRKRILGTFEVCRKRGWPVGAFVSTNYIHHLHVLFERGVITYRPRHASNKSGSQYYAEPPEA